MNKETLNSSFGINVAGFVKGEFGIGEGMRANLRSLEAARIPFAINNFHIDWHRNLDATYQEQDLAKHNPYPVNLVNFNPDGIATFLEGWGSQYLENRYNIGFWAWELPNFPPELQFGFNYFDEIWTFSNHAVEAISAVSPIPVIKVMPSLVFPPVFLGREALGLPKDKFIFLFMFDSLSTFERKNPRAVVEAFIQAFGKSNQDVCLVIKFSNSQHYPRQRDEFKVLAAQYPSIHLIEGHLMREEVNALVYNCDCYVSLHRAEGFGLTMAEAMYWGKPTIATAYSSNIEFMNVGNSFLVKYDLVSISEDIGPYKKGNIWAAPDIEHAAALMHYVFHNYEQAKLVGARAARETQSLLSPHAIGKRIRTRLENIIATKMKSQDDLRREQDDLRREIDDMRRERDDLRREIDGQECQAQAWKNTAQAVQMEVEKMKSKLKKSDAEIDHLKSLIERKEGLRV
ncbi:glycosyltransferase [Microcoleus sp. C2C3]|uniref:glycosyltransferase n=1 Tax=unclassified Microcoleus TaxID=2642155 RepID=UPI002FD21327